MHTIFDQQHADAILHRIDALSHNAKGQWGKLTVSQMLAHCSAVLDLAMGRIFIKRGIFGVVIGRLFKENYYNDKPFAKNIPADAQVVITDERDFYLERERLKEQIKTFRQNGPEKCTPHPHPFLGKLTPDQWATGMYKHLDHHLRQFGA